MSVTGWNLLSSALPSLLASSLALALGTFGGVALVLQLVLVVGAMELGNSGGSSTSPDVDAGSGSRTSPDVDAGSGSCTSAGK
ncbi:BTE_HP_G0035970.mRNA.1.CDS.1 [Saccharomyces cerevisiae]|nr:BTE_HP_G0035970.mRNA.1.CDS.1 [Saccharomyces cerevisiae]CAI6755272.1 BTE_HP_G0035970.mRNA.1.CDS.1 [Saccharomyces cerevisiae]